jgi:hypothetical protein
MLKKSKFINLNIEYKNHCQIIGEDLHSKINFKIDKRWQVKVTTGAISSEKLLWGD